MAEQAKITIHPSYELGEISPRLFSTFLEPIGTMVNGTMFNRYTKLPMRTKRIL